MRFLVDKNNTALYFYDHFMVSAIVLIATVFMLFNHASNKTITLKFFRREGETVEKVRK